MDFYYDNQCRSERMEMLQFYSVDMHVYCYISVCEIKSYLVNEINIIVMQTQVLMAVDLQSLATVNYNSDLKQL